MNIFTRLFSRKDSRALSVISKQDQGTPKQTPRNYDAMAKQGYQLNNICYDAVQKVAKGVSSIKWVLYRKSRSGRKEEIIEHAILNLLRRPNPMQSKAQFFESVVSFYQLNGNTFIEGVKGFGKEYKELWSVSPSYMSIKPGDRGVPSAYMFKYKGLEILFEVDDLGRCDLMHMKRFHPTDKWFGLSPLEPSMLSIDTHNSAAKWNLGLIQNNARPSGFIKVTKDVNGTGVLSDEQFENLKEELKAEYGGAINAGKVMVLEGGLDWQQNSLTPVDLNFVEGNNQNARNISRALGVPPVLLNIPGDSTFNNFKEARLSLYEDTIIPIAESIRDEFNRWLVPSFGNDLELDIDKDQIDALNVKTQERFEQYDKVSFLTINEKRDALGYEPIENGDTIQSQTIVQVPSDPKESNGKSEVKKTPPPPPVIVKEFLDPNEEIKQVNLITLSEKRNTAKKLNALREFYGRNLEKDVMEDYFEKISHGLSKINTTDARLAESQGLRVIDSYDDELKSALERAIKRTSQAFGEPIIQGGKSFWGDSWEVKKERDFTSWVSFFVTKRATDALQIIKGTTLEQTKKIIKKHIANGVEQGLSVTDIAKDISTDFKEISMPRAQTIARTEVGIASNQGSLEAAKSLDIPDLKKEWVAVNDNRVRDDHDDISGTKKEMNEKFILEDGSEMTGPQDPTAPVKQIINCRCVLVFSRR